jgi:hypothetical protein
LVFSNNGRSIILIKPFPLILARKSTYKFASPEASNHGIDLENGCLPTKLRNDVYERLVSQCIQVTLPEGTGFSVTSPTTTEEKTSSQAQ